LINSSRFICICGIIINVSSLEINLNRNKMSPYLYPVIETAEIEITFLELAEQWQRETGMLSVTSKISMHPAYQRIIGMGQPVVPLIMRELEREPDHWFVALSAITGANPVKPEQRGRLKQMAQAWIEWGRANGYRW
jgi:EAL domain-containing protein (putative c-di-GMP-specific phosphodiesterase class I)